MNDITKLKPRKYAVITRNKRLIKSEPLRKLTQLETAIIDWAIFTGGEDWSLIYLLSHPEAINNKPEAIKDAMYHWKNTDKVKKYVETRTAEINGLILAKCRGMVMQEIEAQKLMPIPDKNKGNKNENSKAMNVLFSDNTDDMRDEDILQELQKTFMATEDPKERAALANSMATYKKRTGNQDIEQKVKRFYIPINMDGCRNCQLYKNQKDKVL